jgi:hypothetical protein
MHDFPACKVKRTLPNQAQMFFVADGLTMKFLTRHDERRHGCPLRDGISRRPKHVIESGAPEMSACASGTRLKFTQGWTADSPNETTKFRPQFRHGITSHHVSSVRTSQLN